MTGEHYPSSVRLPSHVSASFKARTWSYASGLVVQVGIALPGVNLCFTQFQAPSSGNFEPPTGTAPQEVPPGYRAEITWWWASAIDSFLINAATPDIVNVSFRKGRGSGTPGTSNLPGWTEVAIDESTFLISAFSRQGLFSPPIPLLAPIHLVEGENATLSMAMKGSGLATTWFINARWGGWIYPVELEGEAGTIRATPQDPGIRDPLGNPFRSR